MSVASDNYYSYRRLLNNARNDKRNSEYAEREYIRQRDEKQRKLENCRTEKRKKEKRLKDVEEIVNILSGKSGWAQTNVPRAIEDAVKSLKKLDSNYRSCIRRTGGSAAADMSRAFAIKSVQQESNSDAALRGYNSVEEQLRDEINDLSRSISSLETGIRDLKSKINQCNSQQSTLRWKISNYEWNMEYWRRKMNEE